MLVQALASIVAPLLAIGVPPQRPKGCFPETEFPASPIVGVAKVVPTKPDGGAPRIVVHVELKNTGHAPARIERWWTLPAPARGAHVFQIYRKDGTPVGYVGRQYRRKPPGPKDFVTLQPGQTLALAPFDITDAYGFPAGGEPLAIKYMVLTTSRGHIEVVESSCVPLLR